MSEDQLFFYFQPYKITYAEKKSFSPDALKNQDNTNEAILGQNFHDPLHHLDPQYREVPINSIPQTVKKPYNIICRTCSGITAKPPAVH